MVIDLTTATGRPSQTKAAWAVYDSTWLAAVVSRVTAANGCGSAALDAKGTPYHRPLRLGPRPFTVTAVNSFGGSFAWVSRLVQKWAPAVTASIRVAQTATNHDRST